MESNDVITYASIANVVVYVLLCIANFKAVRLTQRSIDEMRQTTEFFVMSEVTKKLNENYRSELLSKWFSNITSKYNW